MSTFILFTDWLVGIIDGYSGGIPLTIKYSTIGIVTTYNMFKAYNGDGVNKTRFRLTDIIIGSLLSSGILFYLGHNLGRSLLTVYPHNPYIITL